MRSSTLIRSGVIGALLAAPAAGALLAVGCSSSNGGSPNNGDAGPDGSQTLNPGDDGGDAGTDGASPGEDGGDAAVAPVHGKVILVNAASYAPTAPSLRFCYGFPVGDGGRTTLSTQTAIPSALTGVPAGFGGVSPDGKGVDLKSQAVVVFGIDASKLVTAPDAGTALPCNQLVGDGALGVDAGGLGLVENTDYWNLGTLPAGTLLDGTTTLVVVTGCAPGAAESTSNCPNPTAYDSATGNLSLWVSKVDTTTALDGGAIGAQFANASIQFVNAVSALGGGSGTALAGFYQVSQTVSDAGADDAGDAGDGGPTVTVRNDFFPVAAGVQANQLAPSTLVPVSGLAFDANTGFVVDGIGADGGLTAQFETPLSFPMPLGAIAQFSAAALPTPPFANGAGYVFVLVGNPGAPEWLDDAGTQFDPAFVHVLAFPTNPAFGAP